MKIVKCPRCGKEVEFAPTNIYRPFCSERCKIIDLGDWASQKYSIPTSGVNTLDLDDEIVTENPVKKSITDEPN